MMKTTPIILRNQNSKIRIRLYNVPTPRTLKAINQANMITGIPVAMAKITGNIKPEALLMVMGISMPKYNTPLYGQKANANTMPSSKTSQ